MDHLRRSLPTPNRLVVRRSPWSMRNEDLLSQACSLAFNVYSYRQIVATPQRRTRLVHVYNPHSYLLSLLELLVRSHH